MTGGHSITYYTTADGERRIRIDAPGIAAVSAPVGDPLAFVTVAANELGLEADDSVDGQITVSVPPGA